MYKLSVSLGPDVLAQDTLFPPHGHPSSLVPLKAGLVDQFRKAAVPDPALEEANLVLLDCEELGKRVDKISIPEERLEKMV